MLASNTPSFSALPVIFICFINCCDYKNLKKIFEKYKFSGVIHFAALKSLPESYIFPTKYYENNILSTINIINLIKIYNIPYFVFSSS